MAISPGDTGRADDFIYRTEAQADRADDQGRIPKLEDDGRLHPDFTIPTGVVVEYEGDTTDIPDGFLLCDGSAVSRTTYADLFAKIGTKHGAGNGTTTFNLPDRRGRVPVGYDASQSEFNAQAKFGGAKTHALTTTEMPVHTHTQDPHSHLVPTSSGDTTGSGNIPNNSTAGTPNVLTQATVATNQNAGGGAAHNNLQPYITTLFIIKT